MNIGEFWRLFYRHSAMKVARGMQYRVDFWVGLLVSMSLACLGPLFTYLIFSRINGFPGWNLKQMLLLQGVTLGWLGMKDLLFAEIRGYIDGIVKGGEFDRLLLKPYPALGLILTNGFYYYGLGPLVAGIIISITAVRNLGLTVTWWQLGVLALFLVSGLLLYAAISIGYCTMAVLVANLGRAGEIIDKLLAFSHYPVEIFPRFTRLVVVSCFPVAVWVYLPAQALLNRLPGEAYLSVGFCGALFWMSLRFWNFGIKKYTSAGG